jgi:hypothetical protein
MATDDGYVTGILRQRPSHGQVAVVATSAMTADFQWLCHMAVLLSTHNTAS